MTRNQVHGSASPSRQRHPHPLEIWNRDSGRASYGSIAAASSDDDDDEAQYNNDNDYKYHPTHVPRGILLRRFVAPWVIGLATLVGVACLWVFAVLGAGVTPDEEHRETVVPTLLEVVDPATNTLLYALTNSLYDRLIGAARAKQGHEFPLVPEASGAPLPRLVLDRDEISSGDPLRVEWKDDDGRPARLSGDDVVALFCADHDGEEPPDDRFLEAATVDQIRATNRFHGYEDEDPITGWFLPSFPVLRQDRCFFRLYFSDRHVAALGQEGKPRGSSSSRGGSAAEDPPPGPGFWRAASSRAFHIRRAKEEPTALHLAYGDDPSAGMTVHFATGHVPSTDPIVELVESGSDDFVVIVGTTGTYGAEDLCQAPGNETRAGRFYSPGALHTVELTGLRPNTEYSYRVALQPRGDHEHQHQLEQAALVWSEAASFRTAPVRGDRSQPPFSYLVYGDQGCPHSGWRVGREWMESLMKREASSSGIGISSVHHFGDISYSRGAAHVWDAWFGMVAPMAARVPLMVAIGNHEYDHTDGGGDGRDPSGVTTPHGYSPPWGNFAQDSGGECGVTMAKRFRMPSHVADPAGESESDSNGVFWYSFDYATVHTVVLSSEHDMSRGSSQYRFLEANLAGIDRRLTPWVVLELHRPLYEGEGSGHWWPSNIVGKAMRDEIEDLLLDYKVDLVLSGHYHEYQRSCDGLYRGRCGKGGPMHITVGSAGAKLDNGFELVNTWTQHYIKGEYGYGRITVANHTDLHFEFVRHGTESDPTVAGRVEDEVWIHRDRA